MQQDAESESIAREVEEVFLRHGIRPNCETQYRLNPEQYRTVRDLAMSVVRGNIPIKKIRDLPAELSSELSAMIKRLIALKGTVPVRQMQERNPYYDVLTSRVVRDSDSEE